MGRSSRGRRAYSGLHEVAFSGDGRNMAALSKARPRDKAWYAWNGDIRLKRAEGRIEPVIGGIDQQQEGRFGSQTPVAYAHLETVCPGLA